MTISPIRLDIETLPATPLPISLDLVKTHCAIDFTDQDTLLSAYVMAAIKAFEDTTHRTLFRRGHSWVLDRFPWTPYQQLTLPRGKTRSVDRIEYVNGGVTIEMTGPSSGSPAGTSWQEDLRGDDGGVIMAPRGSTWPSVDVDAPAPVTITFTAGWSADELPPDALNALLFYVRTALDDARTDPVKAQQNIATFEAMVSGYRLSRVY